MSAYGSFSALDKGTARWKVHQQTISRHLKLETYLQRL
jgi:hypothetical protein